MFASKMLAFHRFGNFRKFNLQRTKMAEKNNYK